MICSSIPGNRVRQIFFAFQKDCDGALSGVRKQSVEDVERGLPLIKWMGKKGYSKEATYLKLFVTGGVLVTNED